MKTLTTRWRLTALLTATVTLVAVVACTTVPETGRSALNFYSGDDLAGEAAAAFQQLKRETPVSRDVAKINQLQRIGRAIVVAARERGAQIPPPGSWEFVVFGDPQLNAFAMPGGKVGFFEGIWSVFKDDDDVAVVMGHEIAHVAANHGGERVSQQTSVALGATLGSILLDKYEVEAQWQQAIMIGYGLGSQVGVLLPYSRVHESEADEIGLVYMAQAGYDPRTAIDVWTRMKAQSAGAPPEFLSTHPAEESRIAAMKAQMDAVLPIYEANKHKTR